MKISEMFKTIVEAEPSIANPDSMVIPSSINAVKISGSCPISCQIGKFDVYEFPEKEFTYYFVKNEDGNDIAYAKVHMEQPPYIRVKMVYTKIKGKNIIPGLYTFFVRHLGFKIFSDDKMTDEGVRLWQSLPKNAPHLVISVVDMADGEQYPLADVKLDKCFTIDNKPVILPEKDHKPPAQTRELLVNNPDKYQRFVYIAENYKHIIEREKLFQRHPIFEGQVKYNPNRPKIPFPYPVFNSAYHDYEFGDEK